MFNLNKSVEDYRKDFDSNKPYRHLVIDNFLHGSIASNILHDLDYDYLNNHSKWDCRNDSGIQVKDRSNWSGGKNIPLYTSSILKELNSAMFLEWLTEVTGVEGLIPDVYYDAGGFNRMSNGHHLAYHCDGNKNDRMNVYRALNVIIYLNKDWKEEFNGHLKFKKDDTITSISPLYNRCVIFKTDEETLHGVPDVINCPEGVARKSLILYYYTKDNSFNVNKNITERHSAKFI